MISKYGRALNAAEAVSIGFRNEAGPLTLNGVGAEASLSEVTVDSPLSMQEIR